MKKCLSLIAFVLIAFVIKCLSLLGVSATYASGFETRVVAYELDGVTFESTLVWESGTDGQRPGVLMVPNWMGPTEASLAKARSVAKRGYVVMMADLYGTAVRPLNSRDAAAAAGAVRADRAAMRARTLKALEQMRGAEGVPLDPARVAAIGFCFGGGAVLELARSGADVAAVVSFHGDLLSPTLEVDSGNIRCAVLVLHGADDPYVPQGHVAAFIEAMQGTQVDWQLVQFSNTVHSFTDPAAAVPGQAQYNPLSARRAFQYMEQLFGSIF